MTITHKLIIMARNLTKNLIIMLMLFLALFFPILIHAETSNVVESSNVVEPSSAAESSNVVLTLFDDIN